MYSYYIELKKKLYVAALMLNISFFFPEGRDVRNFTSINAVWIKMRETSGSTSFPPFLWAYATRLQPPRGDAFYDDGRFLEACRRVCDGTDKGWVRVIEARVEGRPRKSRGRAIAKTPFTVADFARGSSSKSRVRVRFVRGNSNCVHEKIDCRRYRRQ